MSKMRSKLATRLNMPNVVADKLAKVKLGIQISPGNTEMCYMSRAPWLAAVSVQLLCLDVHPSRPNLAATGASGGCVVLWDLRFQAQPLAHTGSREAAGDVWEVRAASCSPSVVLQCVLICNVAMNFNDCGS